MRLIRLLKRDLAQEISEWVNKGIISVNQARSICKEYDIDFDSINNSSMAYGLLLSLAYIFIGLALITLIGANWDDIPRFARMLALLILTMGTHGLALWLYLKGKESQGIAIFFLGNIFYGASIILIAQIYHLGEHMPDGIFWWALGSLPFALLLRNSWLMIFSLLMSLLWFFLEIEMGFFPTLFPIFLLASAYVLIKNRNNALLFLTMIASSLIWIEGLFSYAWSTKQYYLHISEEHFFVSIALFIFLYAVSHYLHASENSTAKDYGTALSLWILRFFLITLLVLSFESLWKELLYSNWSHQLSMWPIIIILLGTATWLGWRVKHWQSLLAMSLCSLLVMIAVVLDHNVFDAIYFQIITNIALICSGITLILRGIQQGISHYFFLGIFTILLTGFMRYVDLIGDYIGASILFMLLAFILLGAARFWKAHSQQAGVA
ncbi:MAG: DUF2157 domain-containing protein [Mariprofundales bacterium]